MNQSDLVYEQDLPEMTKKQYSKWYSLSELVMGVRMGPPVNEKGNLLKRKRSLSPKQLRDKIDSNSRLIAKLMNESVDMAYALRIHPALGYTISEVVEERIDGTKRRPIMGKVRRVYWSEAFVDEDSGEVIDIQRSTIIEVDGKKSNRWGIPIKYTDENEYSTPYLLDFHQL